MIARLAIILWLLTACSVAYALSRDPQVTDRTIVVLIGGVDHLCLPLD